MLIIMSETKSILVTGAHGQLGRSVELISSQYPHYQFSFVSRDELDLSDAENMTDYFQHNHFDFIINCAAYTAVDQAEQEPELANNINHMAVQKLAEIAKAQDSALIHISTDYVFDGENCTPYTEIEQTNPQGVYGNSKLAGEQAVIHIAPKGCIIRTSWVYSEFGNNFVKTMLRLGCEREKLSVVFDQVGSPTRAKDLAFAIMRIIELNTTQCEQLVEVPIYHFSGEGVCSWYDFAKTIFELANISCDVSPIETKDYPTPATRPHYSVLNKAKIKDEYELSIPYWKDSLKQCIATLQENSTV
jgi:dTDP-4-dehydrorhamnose reductase